MIEDSLGRPRRQLFYNNIIVYEYFDPYIEPYPEHLLLGLPDVGLVGSIASRYLVLNNNYKLVGEIDSPTYFPPITVIHRSHPISPIQLYMSSDRRIIVLLSETPIPIPALYPLINMIIEYAREINIKTIISLTGIGVPNRVQIKKPKIYWLASNKQVAALVENKGIEKLEEGFIVGPYALLLKEARRRGINNLVLFAESFLDLPDPESAVELLKTLSSILNIEIDLDKLLEEAELLKLKTRELMMHTRKTMGEMQKKYEMQMPLMYQ